MRFSSTLLLFSACVLLGSTRTGWAHPEEDQCTFKDPKTEKYYNLRSLRKTSGDDWEVEAHQTGYTFKLNVCHPLVGDKSKIKSPERVAAVAYRETDAWSLGLASHNLVPQGDRLLLEYRDGDKCGDNSMYRTTLISLVCDTKVRDLGRPEYIGNGNQCSYFFEWRTPAACATSEPVAGSAGGSFLVMVFIFVAMYLFVGVVYNRITHKARGMEQIPHYPMWRNAFEFVKDMTLIIAVTVVDFFKRRSSGSSNRQYHQVGESDATTLIDDDF
ncbi:Cation-independent mannose-6-phosphate receptor CI-MPR [Dispira simplex]|nr:Cation-independent mannose-6-phosphate receptor CI-MPR [Dispira simplex]